MNYLIIFIVLAVVVAVAKASSAGTDSQEGAADSTFLDSILPVKIPPTSQLEKGSEPWKTLGACLTYGPLNGIPPSLIFYTAQLESKFVPTAIERGGISFGLCQLSHSAIATLEQIGQSVPADWQFGISGNIEASCKYARWLYDSYEIPDPGTFREIWTLGPGKYFQQGLRNPSEANKLTLLMNGG